MTGYLGKVSDGFGKVFMFCGKCQTVSGRCQMISGMSYCLRKVLDGLWKVQTVWDRCQIILVRSPMGRCWCSMESVRWTLEDCILSLEVVR